MREWQERWPNFKPEEVLSPRGLVHFNRGRFLVQPHALDMLQLFRTVINKPFIINGGGRQYRGYRNPEENQVARGRPESYHIQGLAFDVTVKDMDPREIGNLALDFGFMGIGVYETFTHLDCRVTTDRRPQLWSAESVSWPE